MKTFYLALILFLLLVGLIIGNALFVRQTARSLEERITALPPLPEAREATEALEAFWRRRRLALSCSVPAGQILFFETALAGMKSAAANGDTADYEIYRAQALLAVSGLCRLERFSAENLL